VDLPAPEGPEMTMGVCAFTAAVPEVGAMLEVDVENEEVKQRGCGSLRWLGKVGLYTRGRKADEMARGTV
jgi:hypothetical protein